MQKALPTSTNGSKQSAITKKRNKKANPGTKKATMSHNKVKSNGVFLSFFFCYSFCFVLRTCYFLSQVADRYSNMAVIDPVWIWILACIVWFHSPPISQSGSRIPGISCQFSITGPEIFGRRAQHPRSFLLSQSEYSRVTDPELSPGCANAALMCFPMGHDQMTRWPEFHRVLVCSSTVLKWAIFCHIDVRSSGQSSIGPVTPPRWPDDQNSTLFWSFGPRWPEFHPVLRGE